MNEQKKRLTTTQLLSLIRRSKHFTVVENALGNMEQPPDFCQYLYELMEHHQVNAKEVIRRSGIERSYFYHILSGQKTPSRNMLLRISLCIDASLSETNCCGWPPSVPSTLRCGGTRESFSALRTDIRCGRPMNS